MRVHEIAKELVKTNKEVIEFLRGNNVEVSSHMSSVSEEHIQMVKKHFGGESSPVAPAEKSAPAKPAAKPQVEVSKAEVPQADTPAEEAPKKKNIVQIQQNSYANQISSMYPPVRDQSSLSPLFQPHPQLLWP